MGFLPPDMHTYVRVRIMRYEMLVFGKFCARTKWMIPIQVENNKEQIFIAKFRPMNLWISSASSQSRPSSRFFNVGLPILGFRAQNQEVAPLLTQPFKSENLVIENKLPAHSNSENLIGWILSVKRVHKTKN